MATARGSRRCLQPACLQVLALVLFPQDGVWSTGPEEHHARPRKPLAPADFERQPGLLYAPGSVSRPRPARNFGYRECYFCHARPKESDPWIAENELKRLSFLSRLQPAWPGLTTLTPRSWCCSCVMLAWISPASNGKSCCCDRLSPAVVFTVKF